MTSTRRRKRRRSSRRPARRTAAIAAALAFVVLGVVVGSMFLGGAAGDRGASWRRLSVACRSAPAMTCLLDEAARVFNLVEPADPRVAVQAKLAATQARLGRASDAKALRELALAEYARLHDPSPSTLLDVVEAYAAAGEAGALVPVIASADATTLAGAAHRLADGAAIPALRRLAALPFLAGAARGHVRVALVHALARAGEIEAARREAADLPSDYRAQALVLLAAALAEDGSSAESLVALVEQALAAHASAALALTAPPHDPWARIVGALVREGEAERARRYLELHAGGGRAALARAFVAAALDRVALDRLEELIAKTPDGNLRALLEHELVAARAVRLVRDGAVGEALRLLKRRSGGSRPEATVAAAVAERGDVELALALLKANPDPGPDHLEARLAVARALARSGEAERALAQLEAVPAHLDGRSAFAERLVAEVAEVLVEQGEVLTAAEMVLHRLPSPRAVALQLARLAERIPRDGAAS